MTDDIKAFLLKLYGYWVLSGFILLGLSLLVVWLTGGFVEIFTELIISLVIESFFFPINVIVAWVITPWQVVFHFIIFIFIVVLFEIILKHRNELF